MIYLLTTLNLNSVIYTIQSPPRTQPHIVERSSCAGVSAAHRVCIIEILQLHVTLYLLVTRVKILVVHAVQGVDTAMPITENSQKPHARDWNVNILHVLKSHLASYYLFALWGGGGGGGGGGESTSFYLILILRFWLPE